MIYFTTKYIEMILLITGKPWRESFQKGQKIRYYPTFPMSAKALQYIRNYRWLSTLYSVLHLHFQVN